MQTQSNVSSLSPQLRRLRDARRVLEVDLDGHPFLDAEGRLAIRKGKRAAWAVIAEVAEELVATLDAAAGDPDLEDNTREEDSFEDHSGRLNDPGPGCDIADGGEDNHDREWVDEREPDEGV